MCPQDDPTELRASKEPRSGWLIGCPLGLVRVFGQAKTLAPGLGREAHGIIGSTNNFLSVCIPTQEHRNEKDQLPFSSKK